MLAIAAEYDLKREIKEFIETTPCAKAKCRIAFQQVWDIDGIWLTHNGIAKIFQFGYDTYAGQSKRQIREWLWEQHNDPLFGGMVVVQGVLEGNLCCT